MLLHELFIAVILWFYYKINVVLYTLKTFVRDTIFTLCMSIKDKKFNNIKIYVSDRDVTELFSYIDTHYGLTFDTIRDWLDRFKIEVSSVQIKKLVEINEINLTSKETKLGDKVRFNDVGAYIKNIGINNKIESADANNDRGEDKDVRQDSQAS